MCAHKESERHAENKEKREEGNTNTRIKAHTRSPQHRVDKNRHTITVVVKQVQREQEEVDSDKIVPLFERKYKKKALQMCWSGKMTYKHKQTARKSEGPLVAPSLQVSVLRFSRRQSFPRC